MGFFGGGATTIYSYDALERLTAELYAADATQNRSYTYNNNGIVVKATDQTGETIYTYDQLGRQLQEQKLHKDGSEAYLTLSEFDKANNRLKATLPSGKVLVSEYDKRNLLTKLTENMKVTTYTYDENGNRASCTLPNGQITRNTYDKANRVETMFNSLSNAGIEQDIYNVVYKRDAIGNQLQAIETRKVEQDDASFALTARTLDFSYDKRYQLLSEMETYNGEKTYQHDYTFDLMGNRLSKEEFTFQGLLKITTKSNLYITDKLNRILQLRTSTYTNDNVEQIEKTYSYDLNGNRIKRLVSNVLLIADAVDENGNFYRLYSPGSHDYFYDRENRLNRVDSIADSRNPQAIFKASYDYRTRRTAKIENGKTTTYSYDGGVTVEESQDSVLNKVFIRGSGMGGGIGSILYLESRDAAADPFDREYYSYNAVGSVITNTNDSSKVIKLNDYDAYGSVVRTKDLTSQVSRNNRLFSTKERDESTGLDNFGFRYYDSELGRFITRDPSGYPDGFNNQTYLNNNPINGIDPLGLKEQKVVMPYLKSKALDIYKVSGKSLTKFKAITSTIWVESSRYNTKDRIQDQMRGRFVSGGGGGSWLSRKLWEMSYGPAQIQPNFAKDTMEKAVNKGYMTKGLSLGGKAQRKFIMGMIQDNPEKVISTAFTLFSEQWKEAGRKNPDKKIADISKSVGILATLFNLGYDKSKPKQFPKIGGHDITIEDITKSFGQHAEDFSKSESMEGIIEALKDQIKNENERIRKKRQAILEKRQRKLEEKQKKRVEKEKEAKK